VAVVIVGLVVAVTTFCISATTMGDGSDGNKREYSGDQNGRQFHQGLLHARVVIDVRSFTTAEYGQLPLSSKQLLNSWSSVRRKVRVPIS
jgi:hypothetical protein